MPKINGEKIRALRVGHKPKLSQEELADQAQVSQQLVSLLETEPEANPTLGNIYSIACVLGVKVDDLIVKEPGEAPVGV